MYLECIGPFMQKNWDLCKEILSGKAKRSKNHTFLDVTEVRALLAHKTKGTDSGQYRLSSTHSLNLINGGQILLPYFCGKNHPVESCVAFRIGLDVMEEEVFLFGKAGLSGGSVRQLPRGPKLLTEL